MSDFYGEIMKEKHAYMKRFGYAPDTIKLPENQRQEFHNWLRSVSGHTDFSKTNEKFAGMTLNFSAAQSRAACGGKQL